MQGWRPTPFRQYILKIHSRCNLACDYCYLYAMQDQSWRSRPATMSPATVRQVALRIAQSAQAHGLAEISVVLHGGEPLLAGQALIASAASTLRGALGPDISASLSIQTNGVLLTRELLDILLRHDISVGVSLDGDRVSNDKHRRYANGRGSYDEVAQGLERLGSEPYARLFAGILCVIDVSTDPIGVFDTLLAFRPPTVDFILPHGNWTRRPPARGADTTATPYADWLIAIFDRWYSAPVQRARIRLFEEIIQLCLGGQSRSEAVGLSPVGLIVVDTDGSLEQVDTLRSAFPGASATGLNVFSHDFGAALAHPAVMARQIGLAALSQTCIECAIHRICGGGYYPHRYLAGSGFRNPSVYCPDLYKLIGHIMERLAADVRRLAGREL
ncbi:MAG: FxsB family cyclophane-forming radical SAM/SPASM peptide maturase [Streptosporangiaceae bacterium]|jgi:uncharacterized protein|nr:radical SAM protein [Actinomycetota bacterium]